MDLLLEIRNGLVSIILFLFIATSCSPKNEKKVLATPDYPIQPIEIKSVKLTDNFWLPIIRDVQIKTIEYALQKCREEGRFDNFLIAGGKVKGEVRGKMPFDDTDVYKTIEGASYSLISSPDARLETLLDSLIDIVKTGQEKDGYLTTWRTINPAKPPAEWVKVNKGERWESLEASHELYNVGHLYEAAVAHYLATGKRNFLEIAIKNADMIVKTFGTGKLERVPGHQIAETGLIKLYRVTGNEEYLKMAKYFLDTRGDHSSGRASLTEYAQDHVPVIQQKEVVGHAVRAVYMYAGMTDVAAIYKDSSYHTAVNNLWENMVNKKMYITGGIGSTKEGEAFGPVYDLPNLTAYSETCAAIGSVHWNHRLFMLTGDVKYYDVLERTLYNGLIAGLSLDGTNFFYPNALEADGVYKFNMGQCTRQSWFDCSCCPTNLIRFLPSVPGLIYANNSDTLFVNLYASNEATASVNGKDVKISQETNYPWNGKVKITISAPQPQNFVLKLRIPGWARGEVLPGDLYSYRNTNGQPSGFSLTVKGESIEATVENGYVVLSREWAGTEVVDLELNMQVRQVKANENVKEDLNKTSLEYGPLVYAVEEADNKANFDKISLTGDETFAVNFESNLLEGVNVLTVNRGTDTFTAIPYYTWSNRGIGKMKVWLPDAR